MSTQKSAFKVYSSTHYHQKLEKAKVLIEEWINEPTYINTEEHCLAMKMNNL